MEHLTHQIRKARHAYKETALRSGTYQYRLAMDGQWMADPLAKESVPNRVGPLNLILSVANSPEAAHLADAEKLPLKNANKERRKT